MWSKASPTLLITSLALWVGIIVYANVPPSKTYVDPAALCTYVTEMYAEGGSFRVSLDYDACKNVQYGAKI